MKSIIPSEDELKQQRSNSTQHSRQQTLDQDQDTHNNLVKRLDEPNQRKQQRLEVGQNTS